MYDPDSTPSKRVCLIDENPIMPPSRHCRDAGFWAMVKGRIRDYSIHSRFRHQGTHPPSTPLHPPVPRVVYPPALIQMFAAGGKKGKGADKEGASRFKKDIITYKNQALQPVRRSRVLGGGGGSYK